MTQASRAGERQSAHQDAVLTAAECEFARAGFPATKVTAIAKSANLALATVYKTFPGGKEEIWNVLHARRMASLVASVEARTAAAPSPLERLVLGIEAVARHLAAHDAYLELNLRASSGWLATTDGAGVQQSVWAAGLEMVAGGVEAARAAGELSDLRTGVATGLIVSSLQVWLADWVASGRDRDADVVVAELVTHLRSVLGRRA